MSWLHRVTNVFRSRRLSRDLEREMSFHIGERAESLRAEGLDADTALREARRRFGNRTALAERTRDVDIVAWLDSVVGDVRYALRGLRRSPVFAVVAIASVALGIGANTAIYSIIEALVLRPLPVSRPEEIVQVTTDPNGRVGIFTNPLWEEVRDHATGFAALAAFGSASFDQADGGERKRVRGSWVSGDYFHLLGAHAAVGRLLTKADDVRGCPAVAVLSHGFWAREYGGRSDIVGSRIRLDGQSFEVVGVVNEGFLGPEVGRAIQVFAPICAEALVRGATSAFDARSTWWLYVLGRRQASMPLEQLRARLAAIAPAAYAATVPPKLSTERKQEYLSRTLSATPAVRGLSGLRTRYATSLTVLMGSVGLLLLIACANVANLLLARAAAREREVAIRRAIGAGRRRLVRQLFTESVLLALVGAAVGLVVSRWAVTGLVALISSGEDPVALDLGVNGRVLAFTVLVSLLTAVLFGLIPALRGTRVRPQTAMSVGGRGVVQGHARFGLGKALVSAQVALSLTLLVGAGLLVGSLRNLLTVDPGFRPDPVLVANVDLSRTGMTREQQPEAQRRILERVRATPGVREASTSALTPISGSSWNDLIVVDGFEPASEMDALSWFNEVSDGYFATLGTRLLAGRDFDRTDVAGADPTAIVNDAFVRKFLRGAPALGRQFRTQRGDGTSDPYTVVGVVENAKYVDLREDPAPTVYLPASQAEVGSPIVALEVRGDGAASSLAPVVKQALLSLHPNASIEFTPLVEQMAASLRRERLLATLSTVFGGVALLLSVLGLYGVTAYSVARRRNEIGIRMALGASGARVRRMVLGDVARIVALGVAVGVAGALLAGKLVGGFLYGLTAADPRVLAGAAAVLVGVALAAGLVPAWRASRVDALAALREQ